MTIGEIIALTFIIIVFSAMIFIGIRLFRWNKRDMAAKIAKNEANKTNLQQKDYVWKFKHEGYDGKNAGNARSR